MCLLGSLTAPRKMASLMLRSSLVFLLTTIVCANTTYPIGDVRNCPTVSPITGGPLFRMEVLPGLGFDNLRNLDMSQVVQYNYSQCKTTNDGRLLIPDDVITIPIQRSRLETYSNIFDHWDNYTSMTSTSINFEASIFSFIGGKFGSEYQHVKQHQVNDAAKTTRIQLRNTLYRVVLEPDAQLNPKFKNRLLDIAANIQSNNTIFASYLSELLVRDYGTHILRNVEAGAVISQIDSISSQFVADKDSDQTSVTASASANFMKKFSFGTSGGFSNGQTDDSDYVKNRYHSLVSSIGGPPIHLNMSLEEWEKGVLNSLVAIDRAGDPLYYVITSTTIPELPSPTLRELVDFVYAGVKMYYKVNTHHGCTNPESPNFNFEANLNDGSCTAPNTSYSFGGVYQECQVEEGYDYEDLCSKGAATLNPLTGNYSCPLGYTRQELHSGTVTHVAKKEVCDKVCHHSGFLGLGRSCQCLTAWVNVLSAAKYQAYWCVATGAIPQDSGFLFGGVYTSKTVNPVTRSMTCPSHFYPLHIGEDLEVCVSDQYSLAYEYSIPFGGFMSCKIGNPLSNSGGSSTLTSPRHCPKTYKQVLATVDEGCEINYCAKFISDYSPKPPKLPPFHSKSNLKMNITQSLVIQGPYGELWVRNIEGNWVRTDQNTVTGQEVLEHLSINDGGDTPTTPPLVDKNDKGGMSAAVSAAISSVLTFFVCTLVVLAVFGIYGVWKRKKSKYSNLPSSVTSRTYASINEGHDDSDTGRIIEPREDNA